jgi:hypothetical protein
LGTLLWNCLQKQSRRGWKSSTPQGKTSDVHIDERKEEILFISSQSRVVGEWRTEWRSSLRITNLPAAFESRSLRVGGPGVCFARGTVIFNLCANGRKLTDFSLFCSAPTRKCCRTARNCHFALHHHAIASFEDILYAISFLPSFAMAPRLKKHDAAAIDRILCEHLEDDYYKIAATYLTTYSIVMKRR